jgi:hypothetical protein
MSSQIRYQFLHSRDSHAVKFDGVSLPLESLKREIVSQNNLHASGMDLVITDTGGVIFQPNSHIPKNTSVFVKQRAPEERTVHVAAGGIPGLGVTGSTVIPSSDGSSKMYVVSCDGP